MNKRSTYLTNKARAIYVDDTPTMTDQAGANETNINVIIGRYGITGQIPGGSREPMYGDFSHLPDNLRDFIETARSYEERRKELPEALRNMDAEELMALTPNELTRKLTPAEPPAPTPTEGEGK